MHRTACRACKGKDLHIYLDLGKQPHSDHFLTEEELNEEEIFYPLRVQLCKGCGLHQLDFDVDPTILYMNDYLYESSITVTAGEHYHQMAKSVCERLGTPKESLAIDIGSNVGILLEGFQQQGMKVLGIDPAQKIVDIANERGVPTRCDLFSGDIARQIREEHGPVKIITGTNVLAHINDWDDLAEGLNVLLDEEGVAIFESPYMVDLIENLEYDTIYHQHLSYLSIKPLKAFFATHNLELFDVVRSDIHGGSIRLFLGRPGKQADQPIVQELITLEEKEGLYSLERMSRFAADVQRLRDDLVRLLLDLKQQGKRVVGIGAPAKGNTMLNYCGLHSGLLAYLTEKSKLKIGRYSPGMNLPILSDEKLFEDAPDYALILPWNFSEEIMNNLKEYSENGGKFIMLPTPRIVEE